VPENGRLVPRAKVLGIGKEPRAAADGRDVAEQLAPVLDRAVGGQERVRALV